MPQRHFFFDMDQTLTPSKAEMLPEHKPLFKELCARFDVMVVSGQTREWIGKQLTPALDGAYHTLAQNGNHAILKDGTELWKEELSAEQITRIRALIDLLKHYFNVAVADEHDLVEERGSQVSYSVIGHHEDRAKKAAFDPGGAKRVAAMRALEYEFEKLKADGIEVAVGGSTTFDFFLLGRNKGFNVDRFVKNRGWEKTDCLYVGDALFAGGNDETVFGVVPTKAVTGPDDTFLFIKDVLS